MSKQIGDMYLAAALLAYDVPLVAINKSNKKRQMFEFDGQISYVFVLDTNNVPIRLVDPSLDVIETNFIARKLMFPPSYPDAIRRIKSSIHADE